MTKALATVALAALVVAGAASADTWRIHFTPAGQAAARAIVLKKADFGSSTGWSGGSVKPDLTSTPPCPGFNPKQSDLLVVGAAETKWQHTGVQVDSQATVLQTPHMVALDWQRTVLAPQVMPCLRATFAKQVGAAGKLVSFGRVSFPRLGTFTRVFRAVVAVTSGSQTVRVDTDVILVGKKSTELTLGVIAPSAARSVTHAAELSLARLLAGRVK